MCRKKKSPTGRNSAGFHTDGAIYSEINYRRFGKKGDVISVARIAGIMAAKRTSDLILLCHPLALNQVDVKITCDEKRNSVDIVATCRVGGRTGVEMEALHAVSVAALTVYDMCKAVDRGMKITDIRLMHKSGGKSGEYRADAAL